jgi:hypothetical protein
MGCEPLHYPRYSGDEFPDQEHAHEVQAFRFRFASAPLQT